MQKSVLLARRLLLPTLLATTPVLATAPPHTTGSAASRVGTTNDRLADIKVTGQVTDEKGGGLPGVTVVVKGTTNGASTDGDGKFSLTMADNATLVVSSVGYLTKEVAVAGRTTLTVALAPDTKALDEVVVTGYQTQRKADLTGAVAVAPVTDIKDMPAANPISNLQGRVTGVNITNTGSPTSNPTVRIRGIGTLGNNDPLYVIDGIPTREGINQINQNDIESIQVLKDASAASILRVAGRQRRDYHHHEEGEEGLQPG